MNIAYHIIAWNQPALLQRLVDRLAQPNAYFFIHIDRKNSDIETYRNLFREYERVKVYWTYEVYWGGFSQVRTQLMLLEEATQLDTPFKYHVLLSGQDYPIKTNAYINEFFETHSCDFLSYNRIEDLPDSFARKYKYFHFLDFKYLNAKDPHRNRLLYYLFYGFYIRLGRYLPQRKFYRDFKPFFGSDWMVLSDETVRFVLDFVAKNPDYVRFMKYTEIPSELFILNVIINTERRTNLSDYPKFLEFLEKKKPGEQFMPYYSSLRYMDWSDRGKNVSKPATLDLSYFDALKTDKNLFARKVGLGISDSLLDKIDAELLQVGGVTGA